MSEGNKKKILIVEDDKTIQKALSIRLRAAGYAVATADDAVSAVPAVQKEQPQLILLDISIPGGDGFGVAARVRELPGGANIPFIFLTASKAPGFKERADQLGAAAFLEKPFEVSELLAAIEQAFAGAARR